MTGGVDLYAMAFSARTQLIQILQRHPSEPEYQEARHADRAGRDAFDRAQPFTANPFVDGTLLHAAWFLGWHRRSREDS